MKIPKPRKLPSGSWFIQLRLGGESVPVTSDSEKQCILDAQYIKAEYLSGRREKKETVQTVTLREVIDDYIGARSHILSPATVRGYRTIQNNRFTDIMDSNIGASTDWQSVCDKEARGCSEKTLKNAWGMVASALKYAGIDAKKITLPQVVKNEHPYLEPNDIPKFIQAVKGHTCEIPALLALHSLRRSEICALTWDNVDLKNDRVLVSGAMVPNEKHKMVHKKTNKNTTSNRYVPIMIPELRAALDAVRNKTGNVCGIRADTIRKNINQICDANGLPPVGIHGLRHSFASLAYHVKMPEEIAMQIGGWANYGTMRKIYTHLAQKDVDKYQNEMAKFYKNANENANKKQKPSSA